MRLVEVTKLSTLHLGGEVYGKRAEDEDLGVTRCIGLIDYGYIEELGFRV